MNSNVILNKAKSEKNDEFYTLYSTIETEISHCTECFRNKTVYCPCDNPYKSNFVKFFALNFNRLGLKRLIATNYSDSQKQLSFFDDVPTSRKDEAYCLDISEVEENTSFEEILKRNQPYVLEEDGDYRSYECMKLMKEADIICTNPPFSLLRDFIKEIYMQKKDFLILGNLLFFASPFPFSLLKKGKISFGFELHKGGRMKFIVPDDYNLEASTCGTDEEGKRYIEVKGCSWISSLKKRYIPDFIELTEHYSPEKYPCYDNMTDCINVDKTCDIPCDYDGIMGVPVSFLDRYNPAQFELLESKKGLFLEGKEVFTRIIVKKRQNNFSKLLTN